MVASSYIPRQGDIVWINLDPTAGHEQAGLRPALVLSPFEYNQRSGLAVFCPITKQPKSYPFEVELPSDIPITGVVLSDHVKSLDWQARIAKFVCKLPRRYLETVVNRTMLLFTI